MMDKKLSLEKRVKKMKEKIALKCKAHRKVLKEKEEQKIKPFVASVIKDFEQWVESMKDGEISSLKKTIERLSTNLDFGGFKIAAAKLKELGFSVEHFNENAGNAHIEVTLHPKTGTDEEEPERPFI